MRINKYLAHHNYCSRREADDFIKQGKVFINGKKANLGDEISEDDTVKIQGLESVIYTTYAYYKPVGIVTTGAQDKEREILDVVHFPKEVFPVGRLDKDSEGLVIMTSDGTLTTKLLGTNIEKEYSVTVSKPITHSFLVHMRNGVKIKVPIKNKGTRWYTTKNTKIKRTSPTTFDIVLTEGKNRQIRRMCSALGYNVENLKRFRIAHITLEGLHPGEYRQL